MSLDSTTRPRDETIQRLQALSNRAFQLAARVLDSADEAEDVVQQAYVQALGRPDELRSPEALRSWFLSIVVNAARMHVREAVRRRRREAVVQPRQEETAHAESGVLAALRASLAGLEEKYRLPLSLCYEQELSRREAAAVLGVPERTLSDRLKAGLEELRRTLARAGYPAAVAAVLGGLKQTAPSVPASLTGKVEALVAKGATAQISTSGGAAVAAAKGGIAMKVVAGIALAGAVAAGVAVVSGGGGSPLPAEAPATNWQDEQWTVEEFTGHISGGSDWGPVGSVGTGVKNMCGDKDGRLFIVPGGGSSGSVGIYRVDVVTPEGIRCALAGTGAPGYRDGPAEQAQFHMGKNAYYGFSNIQADGRGNVYVSDSGNRCIRRIFKDKDGKWMVETVVGGGARKLKPGERCAPREAEIWGTIMVAAAPDGQLTVVSGNRVYQIPPDGKAITCRGTWPVQGPDGKAPAFNYCTGDCDLEGNAYFNTRSPSLVLKATPKGELSWIGGNLRSGPGSTAAEGGLLDGPPLDITFFAPSSGCADPRGTCFYVCGGDEYFIRRIPTDGKTLTSCLMKNGRWYTKPTKGTHPNANRFELDPELTDKSRVGGGPLLVLTNCHISGRDYQGNLYGTQYSWIAGWSQKVKGQPPVATSIYRIRRVK